MLRLYSAPRCDPFPERRPQSVGAERLDERVQKVDDGGIEELPQGLRLLQRGLASLHN